MNEEIKTDVLISRDKYQIVLRHKLIDKWGEKERAERKTENSIIFIWKSK